MGIPRHQKMAGCCHWRVKINRLLLKIIPTQVARLTATLSLFRASWVECVVR